MVIALVLVVPSAMDLQIDFRLYVALLTWRLVRLFMLRLLAAVKGVYVGQHLVAVVHHWSSAFVRLPVPRRQTSA